MTPAERLEVLVRLGLEARERVIADLMLGRIGHGESEVHAAHEKHLRERMAQAAQVWTSEVELARGPRPPDLDEPGCYVPRRGPRP